MKLKSTEAAKRGLRLRYKDSKKRIFMFIEADEETGEYVFLDIRKKPAGHFVVETTKLVGPIEFFKH